MMCHGVGAESGQLAVVPTAVTAGPVAMATVAKGSSQNPWSKFCVGGEIASAAAAKDVVASVAQLLKHVSVTSAFGICFCS
jgi:hypothetical protein